jgi:polysaccharide chain length determinant protein (PEP-CTERM system associated)
LPEAEPNLNETFDRILSLIGRRRWWVILPACITTFAMVFVLSRLSNQYRSEAMLLVVQQQIPQRYVLPTTTTDMKEALQATTDEVLSRTRLLKIIEEFGLYANERKSMSQEGLLELMRHDIEIQPETKSSQRDVNSFKISFQASTPQLAQEVTGRLTSLFIEQNLETREHQATTTTNFLHERLEMTKSKLAEAEEQVRQFKMQHLGELPEQQPGNLAILTGLQGQLQNTQGALSRAKEQREYLQSLSAIRAQSVDADLARLKSERAALLEHYTPQYPGVVRIDQRIADKEALLSTLRGAGRAQTGKLPGDSPAAATGGVGEDLSIAQLRSQLESNRLEIENLSIDERQLRASMEHYEKRLNQTPVREQQIAGIMRNYELLKLDYADLLNKEMQSQMSADLEKRQQGQQFRVIDRPSLPGIPSSPNRIAFGLGGVGAGLALGFVLAFVADFRKGSFHSEKELSTYLAVPLVIGVPLLLTPGERRAKNTRFVLEWMAGVTLTLAVVVAEIYEYYVYRHG